MSLHTLANHLQAAGRGDDKMLVHMTPGEVGGLQSLAMAHGGSLTTNPETGLPEAGFLSSLLPMIAGFALGPAGLGMTAMQAGLTTAAVGTLASGSLQKGIMAGLGAYGGAGLGAGLSQLGTAAPTTPLAQVPPVNPAISGAANTVTPPVTTTAGAPTEIFSGGVKTVPDALKGTGPGGYGGPTMPAPTPGPTTTSWEPTQLYSGEVPKPWQTNLPRGSTPYDHYTYQTAGKVPDVAYERMVPSTGTYTPVGQKIDLTGMAKAHVANTPSLGSYTYKPGDILDAGSYSFQEAAPQSRMDKLRAGFEKATSGKEGLKALYDAMPEYSVIASGLSLANAMKPEPLQEKKNKSLIRPYDFRYNPTNIAEEPYSGSGERVYFDPTFTARTPYEAPGPEYAAAGGLMGYAAGGPVEQMSDMNTIGANTGYPMANISTSSYSNPIVQRPEATNVVAPSVDAGVGAYSGEARFSNGGPAFMGPVGSGYIGGGNNNTAPQPTWADYLQGPTVTKTKTPEQTGYTYSYNPDTMEFTQIGAPAPQTSNSGMFGRLLSNVTNAPGAQPTPKQPKVTGGKTKTVEQPAAPQKPLFTPIDIPAYQTPEQQLGLGNFYDYMNQQLSAYGGYAAGGNVGGESHLGDYSDGGRLLKGPGDGVSDSIPASIGNRQPARLADGEFVIPARIVSEIGNGSTEAGARKLYAMMDRVQNARRKTTGKGKVAVNTKAEKLLPA